MEPIFQKSAKYSDPEKTALMKSIMSIPEYVEYGLKFWHLLKNLYYVEFFS